MEKNKKLPSPILRETLPNGFSFEMLYIEGSTFSMGSESEEAYSREKPIHEARLSAFHMGKFPVTQGLWKSVMGAANNPSFFRGDKRPVERVSWKDTQDFLEKLNELTGKTYRLPTEAEWEYAARGGVQGRRYLYSGGNKLKDVGWYTDNSHRNKDLPDFQNLEDLKYA